MEKAAMFEINLQCDTFPISTPLFMAFVEQDTEKLDWYNCTHYFSITRSSPSRGTESKALTRSTKRTYVSFPASCRKLITWRRTKLQSVVPVSF